MNYQNEFGFLSSVLQEAYDACLGTSPGAAMSKGEFDLVTEADKRTEKYIRDRILAEFPGDGIIGEEFSPDASAEGRVWSVDPIDGTFNMLRGIGVYGMQCGLFVNGKCVSSAIFFPVFCELFTALKDGGAFLNGKRIRARTDTPLPKCIFSFGDIRHDNPGIKELQLLLTGRLHEKIAKIRMFGSAGFDLALLASGRTDGTVIFTRNIWDIGPGILLCREAGAEVRSAEGGRYERKSSGIFVSANPEVTALYESIPK